MKTALANPEHAKTLTEVLDYWAQNQPNSELLRFYPSGEGDYQHLSYQQFRQRCLSIAEKLSPFKGQRALLFYYSGVEFLEALYACFYAGVIAAPAYPPRRNHKINRLQNVIENCQPAVVLSTTQVAGQCQQTLQDALPNLKANWLNTEAIATNPNAKQTTSIGAGDIAFLQYTSGSTGIPKGVMLSHENLISNIKMAERAFALPKDCVCVSWLPLFHDMGLIGAFMMPMFWGAGSWLMPPAAFLQKPKRWLQLINDAGKHTSVASAAPNFAYQLCVDKIDIDELCDVDLSPWVFALNGAEPIRGETVLAFQDKFKALGFSTSTLGPSYGMAECTLLASTRQQNPLASIHVNEQALQENRITPEQNGRLVMSSGSSCKEQTLRIVNPETNDILPEQSVGEIWLKGPHIASGYWQQQSLSQETFAAFTTCGQGPFLRTGDLGFVHNGELFVTGRAKDLLIIRGKNHYPQDIERTAWQASNDLEPEQGAAFTVNGNLCLVLEVKRSCQRNFHTEQQAKALSQAISQEHGISPENIVFIRFASLPKTSSGKVQRHVAKQQFIDGMLKNIGTWQALDKTTAAITMPALEENCNSHAIALWLQQWLLAKTGAAEADISLDGSLTQLGLDSVDIMQLTGQLEQALEQSLEPHLLFEATSINQGALAIHQSLQQAKNLPANDEVEGFI